MEVNDENDGIRNFNDGKEGPWGGGGMEGRLENKLF